MQSIGLGQGNDPVGLAMVAAQGARGVQRGLAEAWLMRPPPSRADVDPGRQWLSGCC